MWDIRWGGPDMGHQRGSDVPHQRGGLTPTNLGHFWAVSKIAYMVPEWSDTSWVTSWGTWEAKIGKSEIRYWGELSKTVFGGGALNPPPGAPTGHP